MKKVAILGGGACGQAFAADFSLSGWEVNLYELPEFASTSLGEVLTNQEITLKGFQLNFKGLVREGVAKLSLVTTNMEEALNGVNLIIVAIPAIGHKPFFEKMIPYLKDEQVVSIFPDNFGSLILRKMMKEKGCKAKIILGGWSSMPYGVRMVKPGVLDCIVRIYSLTYDTLPSTDSEIFFEFIKDIPPFDAVTHLKKGDTMVSIGFSNPNPIVHVPGSLLNVGTMEVSEMEEGVLNIPKGKFSMYKYGMSPAISKVQYAFYQELKRIAKAMNIQINDFSKEQFFNKMSIMGAEYWVPFGESIIPPIAGPTSVKHRYFTEDIAVGTVAAYRFAQKFKVEVPIIESLIRLGSIVCEIDFLKEGISLEDLGLESLQTTEILPYLKEGKLPC